MKSRGVRMKRATPQTPKTAKLSNPPKKQKNKDLRSREYLSAEEIDQLLKSTRSIGRNPHRDSTLILMMYRHALRVSEAIVLRWDQVDFKQGLLHVRRIKNGIASTHPLRSVELRALRQLKRDNIESPYLFLSERKSPLTDRAVRAIVSRAGKIADIGFSVHPHMLRHSTGFYLANKGCDTRAIQCYMGHANIKNTTIYTELASNRYKDFWSD